MQLQIAQPVQFVSQIVIAYFFEHLLLLNYTLPHLLSSIFSFPLLFFIVYDLLSVSNIYRGIEEL